MQVERLFSKSQNDQPPKTSALQTREAFFWAKTSWGKFILAGVTFLDLHCNQTSLCLDFAEIQLTRAQ